MIIIKLPTQNEKEQCEERLAIPVFWKIYGIKSDICKKNFLYVLQINNDIIFQLC